MAGILGEFFSGLHFPRNEARKLLKKFGKNPERNSGQNPGQKFEKFGELSFCDFSDLTIWTWVDPSGLREGVRRGSGPER